jgi:hypothetical protein
VYSDPALASSDSCDSILPSPTSPGPFTYPQSSYALPKEELSPDVKSDQAFNFGTFEDWMRWDDPSDAALSPTSDYFLEPKIEPVSPMMGGLELQGSGIGISTINHTDEAAVFGEDPINEEPLFQTPGALIPPPINDIPQREGLYSTPLSWSRPSPGLINEVAPQAFLPTVDTSSSGQSASLVNSPYRLSLGGNEGSGVISPQAGSLKTNDPVVTTPKDTSTSGWLPDEQLVSTSLSGEHHRVSTLSSLGSAGPASPHSENTSNPEAIGELYSDASEVKKPAGTSADTGTYTCTYHGCTLRFETPAKLQRHKREGHRSSASHYSPNPSSKPLTPAHIPSQEHFLSPQWSNVYYSSRLSHISYGSLPMTGDAELMPAPEFSTQLGRPSVASRISYDSPATPPSYAEERKRGKTSTFEIWGDKYLHICDDKVYGSTMPKLDKRLSDTYADELYNPSFHIASALMASNAAPTMALSPQDNVFSQRLPGEAGPGSVTMAPNPDSGPRRRNSGGLLQRSALPPHSDDMIDVPDGSPTPLPSSSISERPPAPQGDSPTTLFPVDGKGLRDSGPSSFGLESHGLPPIPASSPHSSECQAPQQFPGDATHGSQPSPKGLRRYTEKDWDAQKSEITRLYNDNTLESVRDFMRKQHGLDAT